MGKLFRSWFKKKRKQESTLHSIERQQYEEHEQPTKAKIHSDDEALTFTHGSLLDDVLSGLKDHHDETPKKDAPDSPLVNSIRATLPDHHSQQKQVSHRLSENNRTSIYQQSVVTQTPPCRPTPDSPSISPPPPSLMMAPPVSAATPSTTANTKLAPSSLASHSLSSLSSALPAQRISQSNTIIDQQHGVVVGLTSTPLELGTPDGHAAIVKHNQQQQQQKSNGTIQHDQQQSSDEHQDQHEQHPARHTVIKSPSIVSSKVSHDSNQDKRNRYLQVTGVSMSRMKERHRQECRRSMQPNSNPLNMSSQQQPDQLQPTQTAISSPPYQSFQSNPLDQQNQQKKLNQLAQRHYLTSPSMPSLHPLEPKSFYTPHHTQSQQQSASTIPAVTAAAVTSYPPLPPGGTVPSNSLVRSSSLMTDIYQSASLPDSSITTPSPLHNDFINQPHQWRQQPLFPYQSDIVLPPYNPSQLNTIPSQQHMGSMLMPSSASYRINTTSANHKQMFPRSASVYGGINQYHHQKQHEMIDRISHGGGYLLRAPMMDGHLQSGTNSSQNQRKSMSSAPRLYKPQLSLANLPPHDQQQGGKKSKQHNEDLTSDQAESTPAMNLPTSFLPSSQSPCDESNADADTPAAKVESTPPSNSIQQQAIHDSLSIDPNSHQENQDTDSSNNDHVDDDNVARSNSSCTIHPSSDSTGSPRPSNKNDNSNGGLDEKLEIPSLVEHLPTKLQQQAELRIMKKHRQPHRRRRRFSLPTMPTSPSTSSSSSSLSSESPAQKDEHGLSDAKKSTTHASTCDGTNNNNKTATEANPKNKVNVSNDCLNQQAEMDHPTYGAYQQQQHHHHPGLPVPVCSISGSNGAPSTHRGAWSANSYHSCVAPLAVNTSPICCPPSSQQHNCQQHSHHHYHHQQPQHFHSHHHSCGHPSSIPLATSAISSPCCSTPPYAAPSVVQPPPPCCSQSYHYRHHHHSHHQRCQHRHSHHHSHPKQQQPMKKSTSVMTKVDEDDAATIRSSATKSVLGQKGRQQQKKMTPPSPTDAVQEDDDDDDDHTISGAPSSSPEKKPLTSQSAQRPLFRSFLPRPPRFSTSIPRPPQQQRQQQKKQPKKQQQQKVKVSASKSSYSWIPSRA